MVSVKRLGGNCLELIAAITSRHNIGSNKHGILGSVWTPQLLQTRCEISLHWGHFTISNDSDPQDRQISVGNSIKKPFKKLLICVVIEKKIYNFAGVSSKIQRTFWPNFRFSKAWFQWKTDLCWHDSEGQNEIQTE